MKKISFLFFFFFLINNLQAQMEDFWDYYIEEDTSVRSLAAVSDSSPFNSQNGYTFPTKGTYRILTVFVNIIYDVTPQADPGHVNNWGWNVLGQEGINLLPPTQYFNDIFDVNAINPRQGYFTRFFSECSFDSLLLIGDFTSVEIKQSRIKANGGRFSHEDLIYAVIDYINSTGGLQTIYGHNSISDYDNATSLTGKNIPNQANNMIDYIAFPVLNPTSTYGGFDAVSGYTTSYLTKAIKLSDGELYFVENWTAFGVGHISLKHEPDILVHEFSHSLLGDNSFHTSGGNHLKVYNINTFMGKQKGYGLFHSAFRSCNAYERWRLGWQSSSNTAYDIASNGVSSDIDTIFTGTRTYYLRDFVTYGDAVRIKLPYKDSDDASNQYIWLENHQVGNNGKLDGLSYHFYPGVSCIPMGNPGIYAYYQVGKDVLEHAEKNIVFPGNETDNLRMINAEGNYNMEFTGNNLDCRGWGDRATFSYLTENPISGMNDQTEGFNTADSTIQLFSDFKDVNSKIKDGILYNQSALEGDNWDGFGNGSIMDISSNLTPINAITYYAQYFKSGNSSIYRKEDNYRDTRKKYLTGLSIAMNHAYNTSTGAVFKVDIRWDDYDVKRNVNWTGDIVLKEQLNLLNEKVITLEQNLTPNQINIDSVSGFFAPPTKFTCESGSEMTMSPKSQMIITDKSSFILENGSKLVVQDDAEIIVKSGSTFMVKQGAVLEVKGRGKITIEQGSYICVQSASSVELQDYGSVIFLKEGAIKGANPSLFSSMSCLSNISFTGDGSVINGSQDVYIQNETISSNRYIGGRNIYVGSQVTATKPNGNVWITNNSNVIFDASNNLVFERGFECEIGSTLEVRK
jgi:hypothetical protein